MKLKGEKERWEIVKNLIDEIGAAKIAEIGVKKGHTSLFLLENCPKIKVYLLIDPVLSHNLYRKGAFLNSTVFFTMKSEDAAPLIQDGSLDLVFIDGNHSYKYVTMDIQMWLPKVRKGGILCGHDYLQKNATGNPKDAVEVTEAVDNMFGRDNIDYITDIQGIIDNRPCDKGRSVWIYRK